MQKDDVTALTAQYHHRLLSLEAELKDRVKSGKLSPQAFAKRVSKLKQVHADLRTLRRAAHAEPGSAAGADVGLPVLSECAPEELVVCERWLETRQAELDEAKGEAEAVYRWVLDAVSGKALPLRGTLRLAKLRKLLARLDRRANAAEDGARRLAAHAAALVGKGATDKPTLKGLAAIFEELDRMTARVARLRAAIKKEEARTGAMRKWLDGDAKPAKGTAKGASRPTHAVFQAAALSLQAPPLAKAKKRRDLVEQFWTDVVAEGLGAPDADAMQAAGDALTGGRKA